MTIKTIVAFEEHDDHFLPWDMALDDENKVIGKSPYAGQWVMGFAPKGNMDADITYTSKAGWEDAVVGLVPVLVERGNIYQLTSHVVREVRGFGGD